MTKTRVYSLAKQVGLPSAQAVQLLREAGFQVKSHTSNVDQAAALLVLQKAAQDPTKLEYTPPERKKRPRRRRQRIEADPDTVVIKKYGNRRLYSTDESRYLTLEELEELVRSGRRVKVIDAGSEQDLTAQVLTQILLEGGRAKNFPVSFLEQIIRLGDDALQTYFSRYMMTGLDMFLAAQKEMERRYQQSLTNFGMWPFSAFGNQAPYPEETFAKPPYPPSPPSPGRETSDDDEMEQLRQRLEQLERQVAMPRDEPDKG